MAVSIEHSCSRQLNCRASIALHGESSLRQSKSQRDDRSIAALASPSEASSRVGVASSNAHPRSLTNGPAHCHIPPFQDFTDNENSADRSGRCSSVLLRRWIGLLSAECANQFAASLDVPVIAHAGRSNAPYGDRVGLGSPDNWQKVFARHPQARVCFGHFGGEGLLDEKDEWPAGFLKQIGDYTNAYGDIAYFEDILGRANTVSALGRRLSTLLSSSAPAARKLMYGSDWVMLAIEAHSEEYFARFAKLLSTPLFKPEWVPEILSTNAQDFLGLHSGQPSRSRLEKFYKDRAVDAAWLEEIR